jgi:exopolyphosphatase/guanosine-5'-triphosphate,3'-diphosphate pyrophosphatase
MIVASIDIGTNTVLLLIADINKDSNSLVPIRNEYRMPRIGKGVKETGIINEVKSEQLYEVLSEYENIIQNCKCEKVIVTGTNALRVAKNSTEISEQIQKRFNYILEIVSGETEAEYAYLGAISELDKSKSNLVIDIGGGSTELIFGDDSGITFKRSLQIGSVSATEQFLKNIPTTETEIVDVNKEIYSLLEELKITNTSENVIAFAGTATTLASMNLGLREFEEDKVELSTLSQKQLDKIINELKPLTSAEISNRYGSIMKGREDIILAGSLILSNIMEYFVIDQLNVSSRGIRYGAIVKNMMM